MLINRSQVRAKAEAARAEAKPGPKVITRSKRIEDVQAAFRRARTAGEVAEAGDVMRRFIRRRNRMHGMTSYSKTESDILNWCIAAVESVMGMPLDAAIDDSFWIRVDLLEKST